MAFNDPIMHYNDNIKKNHGEDKDELYCGGNKKCYY